MTDSPRTCSLRNCDGEAVHDHPDSLCPDCYPGDPPESDDQSQVAISNSLAEARAVAGPELEPSERSHEELETEAAINAALDRRQEADGADDEGDEDEADDLSDASLFMGGDSPLANDDEDASSPDPEPTATRDVALPTSSLPLEQLDALDPEERRRAAKKRGLDWPSTADARDQLFDTIAEVLRHEDERVVDAPTSLGKSYTVATTRWGAREDLTGDKPVVHLTETRDARDEVIEAARDEGGEHFVLRARHEACPIAAGDYDPPEDDDVDVDYTPITVDGEPASDIVETMCDGRGLPFSSVHRHIEDHNDQGVELPCCRGENTTYDEDAGEFDDGEPAICPAIRQWDELREGDHPLVIATHNFAHVPGLRNHTNIVVDEEPDFAQDLSTGRVRDAVGAYLREIDAPVQDWESFIQLAGLGYGGADSDAARVRDELQNALDQEPDREWYFENQKAHTLAPALARAIFNAEERANGRRHGKTVFEPPRLDDNAHDEEGWNREWVSVVLDEHNDVQTVRVTPDFSLTRSVVGLDAHPSLPVWQVNTVPHIKTADVLEPTERQLWRRYERGLRVVQVGDATRPLASGDYFDWQGCNAVVEHLRDEYGSDFRTAITASSVEDDVEDLLQQAGAADPETMHYGEEKSRNDFADEPIGFVNGSIDPGDDFVVDLLAELDLDAEPERSETECDECEGDGCHHCDGTGHKRAHGRAFTGDDAESAAAILASVRENHTAQAAGRYARNPDDPESNATVFVRTDAMPPGFADVQVPGSVWTFTDKQERVVEELRRSTKPKSARDLASRADVSKRTVQRVLDRLVDEDVVDAFEGRGKHGATLYADAGVPNQGVVDLEADETTTGPVWSTHTWTVAISDPADPSDAPEEPSAGDQRGEWDWESAAHGGGPPP